MDSNSVNPLSTDPTQQVLNNLSFNGEIVQIADPLKLDIPDDELEEVVSKRIEKSQKFFEEKYNLTPRRRKNEKYLFGRQIADLEEKGKLKEYETRSADNALYEIEASLKPLAMAQMPDIIVTPGAEDQEKQDAARDLSKVVDTMNKKRHQREILGIAFKHLPVYFTAVLKARWDSEEESDGDFMFDVINPEYIIVDHTATSRNPDDMSFIAHCTPMSVQDLIMRFPNKKKETFDYLTRMGIMVGTTPTYKDLASEIMVWEVVFDWYKKKVTQDGQQGAEMEMPSILEPGIKWEKQQGVLWRIGDFAKGLILDKMLDPNFDHEGEDKYYSYQVPGDETSKQEVDPETMLMAMMTGQQIPNLQKEKIYHNYFKKSRKPYYFFGYDQWGKVYLDETSRIEQNIRNQENLDDQNKTILDQLKTRIKHIWGADSGMDKGAIQKLDMDDPRMDVRVEGDPNKVHAQVNPERPDPAQFKALGDTRDRMYSISGSQAIRGDVNGDTAATNNQLARQGNFTRSDDLVEDTINAASEWMAEWQMQFIKLRYTENHLKEILGPKGKMTYLNIRRDMISDGMEVLIKASSTDKLKAQRNAMDMTKIAPPQANPYSNPIDFFRDMDMDDPEGRTERGVMFMTDPQGYFAKYVLEVEGTPALAGALNGATPQAGAPQPGQPPQAPQQPSPQQAANPATEPPQAPNTPPAF